MPDIQSIATNIANKLSDAGHTAYFAGGCVRDELLGRTPKDYDIVTSATPDEVQELFPKSDPIGAHFGVILVKESKQAFEIATFRHDGSYQDGRRPESVTFSTPEEDAQRRDFTVNGLFKDPISGEVIDFVDGKNDLKKKILRAIGDPNQRFSEDALRLMRAIRFATVLDFEIEPATWNAICYNAHRLEQISAERIREELNRILTAPQKARGFHLLTKSRLMRYIVPEVYDLIGCEQPPQWHPEGDVYEHTRIMFELLKESPSEELALAVMLHDIGKPATYSYDEKEDRIRFNGHDRVGAKIAEKILKRLKYSKKSTEAICTIVVNHMNFMNVQQMRTAKVKRFMARDTYEDEMELHRVDCASSNGLTDNYDFLRRKEKEFAAEPLIPEPLVRGKDLIAMGLKPSAQFKEILSQIQTEQLEGNLTNRKDALEWVQKLLAL